MLKRPKEINDKYIKNCAKGYPKRINWKVIAGPPLSHAQQCDFLYDEWDFKIRGLDLPQKASKINDVGP